MKNSSMIEHPPSHNNILFAIIKGRLHEKNKSGRPRPTYIDGLRIDTIRPARTEMKSLCENEDKLKAVTNQSKDRGLERK